MAVTKTEIAQALVDKIGISKTQATEILDLVLETIKQTLEKGEMVKISGFGNWTPRDTSMFWVGPGNRAPATSPEYSVRSTRKKSELTSPSLCVSLPNP